MTWPLSKAKQLTCGDYVVALICALPREKAAARNMLDELHMTPLQPDVDNNVYTCGRIHRHNVVIVCQSDMGTTAAETVATQLVSTFRQLRFGLLVGIAGGVPDHKDIRLGDVIISRPDGQSGGIVIHDRGKVTPAGFESRPFLNGVPELLRNAFNEFESLLMDHGNRIHECIARAIDRNPLFKEFDRPLQVDCLFKSNYKHIDTQNGTCQKCLADDANIVSRPSRGVVQHMPFIHFGTVALGNQVIKDGTERTKIAERYPSVLAIEMEAGGLMNILGCATIRGICDYADSHKNDSWQNYAAATAAAATKEILRIIPEKTSQSLAAEPSFNPGEFSIEFELPPSAVSRSFVKRDELYVIKEAFLHKKHTAQRQVFVLHRVGGIGKTRLAIEFARQYHTDFTGVFWIDGSTKDSVRLGIASLKDRLPTHQQSRRRQDVTTKHADDLQEAINDVLAWLSQRRNNRWLMVFDNVDRDWASGTADPDAYNPMDYFPKSDHGFILVTTRLPHLQDLVGKTSLKVPKMDKDQSRELLESMTRREISGWEQLVSTLDGLPLALALAGSYLRQHRIPVQKYLELYHKAFHRLFQLTRSLPDYSRHILSTWQISFDQVREANPNAAYLLQLWSCLSHIDLWFELLSPMADKANEIPDWLLSIVSDDMSFLEAVQPLLDYSLAESQEDDRGYTIHPVIHEWCSSQLQEKENMGLLAIFVLGCAAPSFDDNEYWALERRLSPHFDQIFSVVGKIADFSIPQERLAFASWCFDRLGENYADLDRMEEAEQMYQRALQGKEKMWGPDHTFALNTVNNLGILYARLGRMEEAEQMYQRALQGKEKAQGPDHTSTLGTVKNLGNLYKHLGRMEEAEQMFQRVLERKT